MRPEAILPAISEAAFTRQVLQLAKLRGWRTAHFRPARTATGWRTAVQGDGAGFPDLVLTRGGRVIFVELKRDGGRLRPEQIEWLAALGVCKGVEVYQWKPGQWAQIEAVLA